MSGFVKWMLVGVAILATKSSAVDEAAEIAMTSLASLESSTSVCQNHCFATLTNPIGTKTPLSHNHSLLLALYDTQQSHRSLYRLDILLNDLDECENGVHQFGPCNVTRFPNCTELGLQQGQTLYPCYNRKPHRSRFWPDHAPKYYIQYDRVFCFPSNTICSSCTPGRLCQSERRCILDELRYNCSKWF